MSKKKGKKKNMKLSKLEIAEIIIGSVSALATLITAIANLLD